MKRITSILALVMVFCLVLSVGAWASGEPSGEASGEAGLAGTYTDGVNTLVIAADGTFSMEKIGQNMEGEDFVMVVTGTVTDDGVFTITGLYDGDINLVEIATEEQVAADLASVEAAFAAGKAAGGAAEPGTYTDGVSTLVIAGDGTFTMETVGENMDGGEFVLTVTGTVTDGVFAITGVFDGDMDLTQLASADQLAANLATAEALVNG